MTGRCTGRNVPPIGSAEAIDQCRHALALRGRPNGVGALDEAA